jgi:hypothetical protein
VRTAAGELQSYIQKSTSVKLPLLSQITIPTTPYISLGDTAAARAAELSAENVGLEGFRIVTRNGNIFILGPDLARTQLGGTSTGTANGVYTFLEDYFNIRWLLPGEMGEDVPELKAVAIPAIDRTQTPIFQNRRMPYIQSRQETVLDWQRRHKLGYSMRIEHAHNWLPVITPEMFKTHPEWFAEVNGKRLAPEGDRYKIETTNPEVIQMFADAAIRAFRANPNLYMFSISPSDGGGGWSESAETQALLERDPHGNVSRTKLILKFYNDVAKIVGKEFPDRKIAGYIYTSYLYPPKDGVPPMEPNLFIAIATSISYGYKMYRPAVQQEWDDIMKAWSSQTENLSYYDMFNWLRYNGGSLTPPAPEILNYAFPRLAKYKVKGTYIYGLEEWSQAGVNNYALAKLSWNPNLDARGVCNEFYRRAYGEAAAVHIQQLYELLDAKVKEFYLADKDASYVANPKYRKNVLAANYPQIEQLYLAAQAAATNATPAQKARLAFFRDNLIVMQWTLRSENVLPVMTNSPLYRTDAEVEAVIGKVNPAFGLVLANDTRRRITDELAEAARRRGAANRGNRNRGNAGAGAPATAAPRPNGAVNNDADE